MALGDFVAQELQIKMDPDSSDETWNKTRTGDKEIISFNFSFPSIGVRFCSVLDSLT